MAIYKRTSLEKKRKKKRKEDVNCLLVRVNESLEANLLNYSTPLHEQHGTTGAKDEMTQSSSEYTCQSWHQTNAIALLAHFISCTLIS
jgi:hypothetical protein